MPFSFPDPSSNWMATPQRALPLHLRNELQPSLSSHLRCIQKTQAYLEAVADPDLAPLYKVLRMLEQCTQVILAKLPDVLPYCEQQSRDVSPAAEKNLTPRECLNCTTEFQGHRLAKYCSPECREKYTDIVKKEKNSGQDRKKPVGPSARRPVRK